MTDASEYVTVEVAGNRTGVPSRAVDAISSSPRHPDGGGAAMYQHTKQPSRDPDGVVAFVLGWIAIAAVVSLVAWAAWQEWHKYDHIPEGQRCVWDVEHGQRCRPAPRSAED